MAKKSIASKVGAAPLEATTSSAAGLEDETEYHVQLSRAVRFGRGRPLLPDHEHIMTGKTIKEILENEDNDGALGGIVKVEKPQKPEGSA